MTAPPRIVLWDLMDTLVRDPFFTHVAAHFGLSFDELMRDKHPTAWRDFELGVIDEQTLYRNFFADGRAIDGPGLKRTMLHAYAWIDGIPELLRELVVRGVSMHLLSNYPPWYALLCDRLGVSELVTPSFVSCHTGVRKPDPEAYLGAARELAVSPAECLFVDDREGNVRAAREVGMPAVRFTGDVGALRAELCVYGLLEP
jgi:FMN phosphatase YigB (HAD superfamily)